MGRVAGAALLAPSKSLAGAGRQNSEQGRTVISMKNDWKRIYVFE